MDMLRASADGLFGGAERRPLDAQHFISDVIKLGDLVEKGFKRLLSSQDMVKVLVRP